MGIRHLVERAKQQLGIDCLALAIHDASFPSLSDEDVGRGTPYSEGGARLLRHASQLGFDAIQLGPQGLTSAHNPSPYDATAFARNTVALSAKRLREDGWIAAERLRSLEGGEPWWCDHAGAHAVMEAVAEEAWQTHRARPDPDVVAALRAFEAEHEPWLVRLALYEVLARVHGDGHFARWPSDRDLFAGEAHARQRSAMRASLAQAVERLAFLQLLAHRQHAALREEARALGLALHGDLHVGLAPCDEWGFRDALLEGYRLGAPPSRTNPAGQPWGYAVMHPAQRSADSPAGRLVRARFDKALDEYDAVRIDHPHGLVCPWVFLEDDPDRWHAVAHGARLLSSPHLADHPSLADHAIVAAEQLDTSRPRHDDDWVTWLTEPQIDRYAAWLDIAVGCAERHGGGSERLICEVLSTRPRPLAAVAERYRLGRFRVSEKADPEDPDDVYRPANAAPEDWVMIGTHDTPSLWALLAEWSSERHEREAHHLAETLGEPGLTAADPGAVARAKLAELLACPARNVMIFFSDLFGLRARYNTPGTVGPHNWRLRLPPDFDARYERALEAGHALDLPGALALALRARRCQDADLIEALWRASSRPRG